VFPALRLSHEFEARREAEQTLKELRVAGVCVDFARRALAGWRELETHGAERRLVRNTR